MLPPDISTRTSIGSFGARIPDESRRSRVKRAASNESGCAATTWMSSRFLSPRQKTSRTKWFCAQTWTRSLVTSAADLDETASKARCWLVVALSERAEFCLDRESPIAARRASPMAAGHIEILRCTRCLSRVRWRRARTAKSDSSDDKCNPPARSECLPIHLVMAVSHGQKTA